MSSTKHEVKLSRALTGKNVQKRVMHAESCRFPNLNLMLFSRPRCRRRRRRRCLG